MPSEKWKSIFTIIALFPMCLNLAATYSPDTIIIGCTLLAFSYAMHLKYEKEKINIKNIILFAVLCMIPALCKIVYFPLILLFFTLPKEKFENKTKKNIYFALCLAIVFVPYLLLNMIVSKGTVAQAIRTNPIEQIIFSLSNIARDFGTAINTLYTQSSTYLFEMIGGWNTIKIICIFIFGILLFVTFSNSKESEKYKLTKKDKIIFLTIILIEMLGIFVAMYIGWTQGRQEVVEGVQGRYFLPIIPLIMILINKPTIQRNIKNKDVKYVVTMAIIYLSIIIYTISIYAHEIIFITQLVLEKGEKIL